MEKETSVCVCGGGHAFESVGLRSINAVEATQRTNETIRSHSRERVRAKLAKSTRSDETSIQKAVVVSEVIIFVCVCGVCGVCVCVCVCVCVWVCVGVF